jgi:hypothetical protein
MSTLSPLFDINCGMMPLWLAHGALIAIPSTTKN